MEEIKAFLDIELFSFGDGIFRVANILGIVAILVISWIVGRLSSKMVDRLKRFRKKAITDDQRSSIHLTRRSVILLLTIISILISLPAKELFSVSKNTVHVIDLINIVIVFVLARTLVWYFRRWFTRLTENRTLSLDHGRSLAISQIFSYAIYVLAVLLALTSLKIDINLIIASTAGLFVGVGLALQHIFDDFMSGIIILFDGTLEVNDWVVVDTVGLEGKVVEIRLRTTVIETLDNISVVVPNSKITSNNVINRTFNDQETRFSVTVGVAYGSNLQIVRKALLTSAESHGKILKKPEPKVRFTDFGDSALAFDLLFWTKHEESIPEIKSDLRFKIEAEFRRHRISIPFPQRDLHLVSDHRGEKVVSAEAEGKRNPADKEEGAAKTKEGEQKSKESKGE